VVKGFSGLYGSVRSKSDGDVGYGALRWVKHICWHARHPAEAHAALNECRGWMFGVKLPSEDYRASLLDFWAGVDKDFDTLAPAFTAGGMSLWAMATGRLLFACFRPIGRLLVIIQEKNH
jgi:hypothetical protein